MHFSDQLELFDADRRAQCLRFEIGNCLGPCAGGCSRVEYRQQVDKAFAFLEGRDTSCLQKLEQQLAAAASEQRFEVAARLHETLESLTWLANRMDQLRGTDRRFSFVYRVPHAARGESWYLIQSGQVTAVGPRPLSPRTATRWLNRLPQVAERRGQSLPMPGVVDTIVDGEVASMAIAETTTGAAETPFDMELSLLVGRWFRENPSERRNTLTVFEAARHCRKVIANEPDPHLELNQLVATA